MRENLLLTVGLYEWGAVQVLSGSSDNEHVPIVQYAVAVGQSSWSAFRLEGQDREPHLLRGRRSRAELARPSFWRVALLSLARAVSPCRRPPSRAPSLGYRPWPA